MRSAVSPSGVVGRLGARLAPRLALRSLHLSSGASLSLGRRGVPVRASLERRRSGAQLLRRFLAALAKAGTMDHGPKEGDAAGPTAGDAARGNAAATTAASSSSGGVVVQVREKKGPLRAAIPYMPFPVAVLCLFLNTFVPGLGKPPLPFTIACPLGGARVTPPAKKKTKQN